MRAPLPILATSIVGQLDQNPPKYCGAGCPNLRPIGKSACFVGQPILAAAGFQPALFVSRFADFSRKRRSRRAPEGLPKGPPPARVNALRSRFSRANKPRQLIARDALRVIAPLTNSAR